MELPNLNNYGFYKELSQTGYQVVNTDDINDSNIDEHFQNIINILNDGIETNFVQNMKLHVIFPDDALDLYIFQYMYNLMFWSLVTCSGRRILSTDLFFEKTISQDAMKKYIDNNFIRKNNKSMDIMLMNQSIDRCIGKFRALRNFQMYLSNTVNFEDTIDLMNEYPEFDDLMHISAKRDHIPFADIKEYGMKAAKKQIEYITAPDSNHNGKYSFQAGQGINEKQFKEVTVNIGTKPSGNGKLFGYYIDRSFINGGLQTIEDVTIDSSIGRIAQILTKENVGQTGAFARRLGLNNQESFLNPDPNYICNTQNFMRVTIKDQSILNIYDMRYFRFIENGPEHLINASKDQYLIGQTVFMRSPITCQSAAEGRGVCYRCYGDLAYANANVNIGQIAAEQLSSVYTQTLLSAKHLLESNVIKLKWCPDFSVFFEVQFDQIVLKEELDYKKYTLRINSDDIIENESDDEELESGNEPGMDEENYVYSFIVIDPGKGEHIINTEGSDPIYLSADLIEYMNHIGENEDGNFDIPMVTLQEKGIPLFTIEVSNSELSKTMKSVKNLIDSKAAIKSHDKDSLLEAFEQANISGGIKINASHFEVLLSNQIRDSRDILQHPDWTVPHQTNYQLITLEDALVNNMSITVRLQSSKLNRTIINPSNRFLYKAGNMDLFYMEKPQMYMSGTFEKNAKNEEKKVISPIYFDDEENPDRGVK